MGLPPPVWLVLLIKRKEFYIAIRAVNGRLDYASHMQTQLLRRMVDLVDNARMFLGIANDAALSHFSPTNFKLRFDKRN